jgi:hypothetical protein
MLDMCRSACAAGLAFWEAGIEYCCCCWLITAIRAKRTNATATRTIKDRLGNSHLQPVSFVIDLQFLQPTRVLKDGDRTDVQRPINGEDDTGMRMSSAGSAATVPGH